MRSGIAILVTLLALPAVAAEPPTPIRLDNSRPTQGSIDTPGEVDRYSVRLTRGVDYAVGAGAGFRGADLVVKDPGGRVLARLSDDGTQVEGVELWAARTGTYIVEVLGRRELPSPYSLVVGSDCRAGRTTQCSLRPGQTQRRAFTYAFDEDWRRLSLRVGRTYTLTLDADQVNTVAFVDAGGRTLAGGFGFTSVTFRPGRSGTYYAKLERDDDFGGTYRVSLAER